MHSISVILLLLLSLTGIAQNKLSLLPYIEKGKWGYIDKSGTIKIEASFDKVGTFKGNYVTVKKGDLFYLIDTSGKYIFNEGYNDIQLISEEYVALKNEFYYALADWKGIIYSKFKYNCIRKEKCNTLLLINNDSFYDLFNTITQKLTEGAFSTVIPSSQNYLEIRKGNKVGILDSLHHFILPMNEGEKAFLEQTIPIIKNNYGYSIYSRNGMICGDSLNWKYYKTISNNFISVWNSPAKKYLISVISERLFPYQDHTLYEALTPRLLIATKNKQKGIVNDTGELIHPYEYSKIILNQDKTIRVVKDNKIGILSNDAEILFTPQFDDVENFDKMNQTFASINGLWGIINKTGKIIVPIKYFDIEITEDSWKCYTEKGMDIYMLINKNTIDEILHFDNVGTVSVHKLNHRNFKFRNTIDSKENMGKAGTKNIFTPAFVNFSYPKNAKIKCLIPGNFTSVIKLYGMYNNVKQKLVVPRQYWDIQYDEFEIQEYARAILPGDKQVLLHKNGGVKNMLPAPKNGKTILQQIVYIGPFIHGLARVNIGGNFEKGSDIKELNRTTFDRHSLSCKGGYWGYINGNGEMIIKAELEYASDFHRGKAIVKSKGKYGVIDTLNQFIIKPIYDYISYLENTDKKFFKLVFDKIEWGIMDRNGLIIKNAQYEKVEECRENRIPVKENGKWGCLNFTGESIISSQFDFLNPFHEGIAAYKEKNKWGFIDSTGKRITSAKYIEVLPFCNGLAAFKQKGKWGFINNKGNIAIAPSYSKVSNFKFGISCVYYKRKWFFIDTTGKKISKKHFSQESSFNENGLAIVRNKKHCYILKKSNGKTLHKGKYKDIFPFSEGMARIKTKDNKMGFIDTTGKLIIPPKYLNAGDFNEGLARVRFSNGKWGYINKTNNVKIEPIFQRAEDFSEGKSTVIVDKYTTVIDSFGVVNFKLKETDLGKFKEGMLLLNGNFYNSHGKKEIESFKNATAFTNGNTVIKYLYGDRLVNKKNYTLAEYPFISELKDSVTSFFISNRIGLADENGIEVIPVVYQNMTYLNDGIFRISHFDAIGYIHQSGNWIWKPTR